jgi:3-oxoadipate enol-lactonase
MGGDRGVGQSRGLRAHELVQTVARRTAEGGRSFREELLEDAGIREVLSEAEIEAARKSARPVPQGGTQVRTERTTVYLHHLLEGPEDAPVLVMANSLGTTLRMWDDQVPELRERFRLLRYDHRGHGGSSVPPGPYEIEDLARDALALFDRLGIDRFSFCGLSIGGMVGMWLASEVPERVEHLALCCTSALLGPRELWDERIKVASGQGMDALVESVIERWFTPEFFSSNPEKVEKAARMLRETDPEGYAGCCAAIRDMDLRSRLPRITAPTLVIAGAEDPATPPEHGEHIRDSIPGARFDVVKNVSHLANIERPEAVTRMILDHLAPVTRQER